MTTVQKTKTKLLKFVREWNSDSILDDSCGESPEWLEELVNWYSVQAGDSLRKTLLNESRPVGASQLGKELCSLGYKKLQSRNNLTTHPSKLLWIFHLGDIFESFLFAMLSQKFDVSHLQEEVDFHGILGHVDGVLDGSLLVEVKTMNDRYFKQFARQPNDERGYMSQLDIYSHCINLPAVWLVINKTTNKLLLVDHYASEHRLKVLISKVKKLNKIKKMEDLPSPPPPVDEYIKGYPTGRRLIPPSMRWDDSRFYFYDTMDGVTVL